MLGCRPCDTPIDPNCKLEEDEGERLIDVGRYQRLVGKLISLLLPKLDISYAVGLVSQFMHGPTTVHLEATYRILGYTKRNPSMGLLYRKNVAIRVEGYTDVNWVESITDKRSTSGYYMFVGGNLKS